MNFFFWGGEYASMRIFVVQDLFILTDRYCLRINERVGPSREAL